MKTIKIISVFLFFVSCSAQKQALKISVGICKQNIEFYNNKKAKVSEKRANKIRKELIKKEKLTFISLEDFLYIIEGYDFETDKTYTKIWNSKEKINFISDKKSYKIVTNLYSDDLINLIEDWNIKELDKKKGTALDGLDLYIYKVLFNEKGKIKSIKRYNISGYGEIK